MLRRRALAPWESGLTSVWIILTRVGCRSPGHLSTVSNRPTAVTVKVTSAVTAISKMGRLVFSVERDMLVVHRLGLSHVDVKRLSLSH